MDHVIDSYGRRLLELCHTTGLLIANGRIHNDQHICDYTFCANAGLSTVDYLLLNFKDFDLISDFDILDLNEYSDHASLLFQFSVKNNSNVNSGSHKSETSSKFIWDTDKVPLLRSSILSNYAAVQSLNVSVCDEPIHHVVHSTLLSY